MKIATIAYLPPMDFPGVMAFKDNLSSYNTRYPIVLYSNDKNHGTRWMCDDPERVKCARWYVVSNAVFLSGLYIAQRMGLDYFFYLESDSRVRGDHWDEVVFSEHFALDDRVVTSGTPILWDIHSYGNKCLRAGIEYASAHMKKTGRPPGIFGRKQPHDASGLSVYANGSCAIYKTTECLEAFHGYENPLDFALKITAYDLHYGQHLGHKYRENVFDVVGGLAKVFSGCTDVFVDYEERKRLLSSGEVVAMHQAKDDWIPS